MRGMKTRKKKTRAKRPEKFLCIRFNPDEQKALEDRLSKEGVEKGKVSTWIKSLVLAQ